MKINQQAIDELPFELTCLHCAKQETKTVGWITANAQWECPRCRTLNTADASELHKITALEQQLQAALKKH